MKTIFVSCALLLFAACSTPHASPSVARSSIATNPHLPAEAMARFYSEAEWNTLKSRNYVGYVILEGFIGRDSRVGHAHLIESCPDDSRNSLAAELSRRIKISPFTIGSHIRPVARVYVLFYEDGSNPREAVVYAEPGNDLAPVSLKAGERMSYLLTTSY